MAIRDVVRMGTPSLFERSREVSEFGTRELDELIHDLWETMEDEGGIGIAAPQIGVNLRVVVFGREESLADIPPTVLINPVITPLGAQMDDGLEGCLSVPGMRGIVPRYRTIHYRGQDAAGKPFEREVSDYHARVVQHECDHLDGVLYPMRIPDLRKFSFTEEVEAALLNSDQPRTDCPPAEELEVELNR